MSIIDNMYLQIICTYTVFGKKAPQMKILYVAYIHNTAQSVPLGKKKKNTTYKSVWEREQLNLLGDKCNSRTTTALDILATLGISYIQCFQN